MLRDKMTPEEMEDFGSKARSARARARNMEEPNLPPTPSASDIYEVTTRGDGRGVKVRS
jgi:hypothetical protein